MTVVETLSYMIYLAFIDSSFIASDLNYQNQLFEIDMSGHSLFISQWNLLAFICSGMTITSGFICLLGHYDVPKGTMVIINHWALHHDPNAWENVSNLIPERFLDTDGKMGPKPENWLPFSAGRRVCLGESVAKPELHLLFACLMQRFSWRMPEGEKIDLSPTGNSLLLFPKPHQLIVETRMPKVN